MNDVLKDKMEQMIELRIEQLAGEVPGGRSMLFQKKLKEDVDHMNRILNMLPEGERQWLDEQLIEEMFIPLEERKRYYKAGLADAIGLLQFLRS